MRRLIALSVALAVALATLAAPIAALAAEGGFAYVTLSEGDAGDQVTILQRRLSQLGFYVGEIDGGYGQKTVDAVKAFQSYLILIESLEFDGVRVTEPPEDTASTLELAAEEEGAFVSSFEVNGVADEELQAILYDDGIDLFAEEVSLEEKNAKSEDALRVQRKLVVLNYLSDAADGVFGVNSVAALKKFQKTHGLPATGVTDAATRAALYSLQAIYSDRPVYRQLQQGAEGDIVRTLQERMWLLGFSTSRVDGKYGPATVKGVKNIQNYLYASEHDDYQIVVWSESPAAGSEPIDEGSDETLTTGIVGYTPSGVADPEMIELILEANFPIFREQLSRDRGNAQEVMRVQRRLYALEYMAGTHPDDGDYGEKTEGAIREFQSRNGLADTGIADEATQRALFHPDAVKALKPYLIKVSVDKQRVYVYVPDANEDFTVLYKTFVCSTGLPETPTPTGTFVYTSPSTDEWHFFKDFKSWAHYPFYIYKDIMFHSVLYNAKDDEKSLQTSSRKNLGKRASHGCIRLAVEDAKWIYDNCPKRTTVIIF